jgi:hypothetical protein
MLPPHISFTTIRCRCFSRVSSSRDEIALGIPHLDEPGKRAAPVSEWPDPPRECTISAATIGSTGEALKAFALHPLVDTVSIARELLAGYVVAIPDVARPLAKRSLAA